MALTVAMIIMGRSWRGAKSAAENRQGIWRAPRTDAESNVGKQPSLQVNGKLMDKVSKKLTLI